MNIEEVLAKVDSKMRKNFKTGVDFTSEKLELPSVGLTRALGGGLPFGRMVTIHGSKSAGKSSLALQAVATAQQKGKACAWIDAEKSYDKKWAARLGVDNDNILVSRASDTVRAGDEIHALIKAGIQVIVVDSIGALLPPGYLDKDGEFAGMDSTKKIGDFAQGIKRVIKAATAVNDECLVILISQQTTMIGNGWTKNVAEGGKAVEYYSSQVIKLESVGKDSLIKKEIKVGNKIYDGIVGRTVNWTVDFNKVGPAHGTGSYEFYFMGDSVGVDRRLDLLNIAIEQGVVEKAGAWFKYDGEAHHGADKAIEWLSDEDNFEQLKEEIV